MSLTVRIRRILYTPNSNAQLLAKRLKHLVKPILLLSGMRRRAGEKKINHLKPTVVVVSHEASETGAPILALNICQELSKNANIIIILPRGGALLKEFLKNSSCVLRPRLEVIFSSLLRREFKRLLGEKLPEYAIVNSVVSAGCIQPLRALGIPTTTLIHEFSAYIRPIGILDNVAKWSNRVVFSSPLTRDDILNSCPQLNNASIKVLPQGPCKRPGNSNQAMLENEKIGDAWNFLENLDSNSILILAAGAIQPRKGVDLFISVADELRKNCKNMPLQFAWIGSGYDPLHDFNVSLWLEDQIHRSGLKGELRILDHSSAYNRLINRADIFLVTSRLDPLPNVAIDAMLAGKPMLCFEKACGMANLLIEDPILGNALVASYLNTSSMAEKAANLVNGYEQRQLIARRSKEKAQEWFNMSHYIKELKSIAEETVKEEKVLKKELEILASKRIIDEEFCFKNSKLSKRSEILHYLVSWRNEVWPRKPFPGFHPGIYKEQILEDAPCPDPLIHYLKENQPKGEWNVPMITPASSLQQQDSETTIALHVHVHYPELLDTILNALNYNKIRPDLFLSCTNHENHSEIQCKAAGANCTLKSIITTPNRGRDIGPLLTEIGKELDTKYEIYGHLHTKKSVLLPGVQGSSWRDFLISNLVGMPDNAMADRIVTALKKNPKLGLVFPDDPTCVGWSGNRKHADILANKLNLGPLPRCFDFPVGTMFWAKKGALTELYNLNLSWEDYPQEPLGYDGTILHAIERLLPIIAAKQGFTYNLTNVPGVNR